MCTNIRHWTNKNRIQNWIFMSIQCQSANTYGVSRDVDMAHRYSRAILLSAGNVYINRLKCTKLWWWMPNKNSALSADDWRTSHNQSIHIHFHHFDWMLIGFCMEKLFRRETIGENGFCGESLVVHHIRRIGSNIVHFNEAEERATQSEW